MKLSSGVLLDDGYTCLLYTSNQVIWKVPEGVFDQCLALYAQEMASQLN